MKGKELSGVPFSTSGHLQLVIAIAAVFCWTSHALLLPVSSGRRSAHDLRGWWCSGPNWSHITPSAEESRQWNWNSHVSKS